MSKITSGGMVKLEMDKSLSDDKAVAVDDRGMLHPISAIKSVKDVEDIFVNKAMENVNIVEVRMSEKQLSDYNNPVFGKSRTLLLDEQMNPIMDGTNYVWL